MAEKIVPDTQSDLAEGPSAFGTFMERNQKGMALAGAILVLGGLGWTIQHAVKVTKADNAAEELSHAATPEALQKVASERAETPAGPTAKILLANEQWNKGEQEASIETLRSLLASSSDHPAIPSARASLAVKLMLQGKNDEATTLFQQVANDPNAKYLAPYALTSLGDLAKAAGKTKEAEDFYKQAKGDAFAANPFSQVADQHLMLVKFKPPVEIEAPAPPPATPENLPAPGIPGSGANGNPLIKNFGPNVGEEEGAPGNPPPLPLPEVPVPKDPTPPEPAPPAPPQPGK